MIHRLNKRRTFTDASVVSQLSRWAVVQLYLQQLNEYPKHKMFVAMQSGTASMEQ